jgi:ketosteroid isomerase-like protein
MNWIDNNVFLLTSTGIFIAFVGFFVAVQMKKKPFWYVGGLGLFIAIASIIISYVNLNDAEQVEETIYELARLVENEDVEQLLAYFSRSAISERERARARMMGITVHSCRITRFVNVEVFEEGGQKKATAEFVARADVSAGGYDGAVFRKVILNMQRNDDGVWMVESYSSSDPFN